MTPPRARHLGLPLLLLLAAGVVASCGSNGASEQLGANDSNEQRTSAAPCDEEAIGEAESLADLPEGLPWTEDCVAIAVFIVPHGAAMLDVYTDHEDTGNCAQAARDLREVVDATTDWPDLTSTWFATASQPVIDRADACVEGIYLGPGEYGFPNPAWGCLELRIESDFPGMYTTEQFADAQALAEGCEAIVRTSDPGGDAAEAQRLQCQAEEDWIAAEERAYAALDAGNRDQADELILTEVLDAFVDWRNTLEPIGLADEVGPYVEDVETWFAAASDDGIEGYDSSSREFVVGDAADQAFEVYAEWFDRHCY